MAFPAHSSTPAEVAARLAADRRGRPYVALRDAAGTQVLVELAGPRMGIGRGAASEVAIPWDPEVSRVHALLEEVGEQWTVVDDGASRNGTYVDEERVVGRRLLTDGCVLRVGATQLLFRDPRATGAETLPARDAGAGVELTPVQRRILAALCRPMGAEGVPASNQEIAAEVHLSVEGVRTQLKRLFVLLAVPDLPQGRKRVELARRAVAQGHVRPPS